MRGLPVSGAHFVLMLAGSYSIQLSSIHLHLPPFDVIDDVSLDLPPFSESSLVRKSMVAICREWPGWTQRILGSPGCPESCASLRDEAECATGDGRSGHGLLQVLSNAFVRESAHPSSIHTGKLNEPVKPDCKRNAH